MDKMREEENRNEGGEIEISSDDKLLRKIKGEEIKNESKNQEDEAALEDHSQIRNNKLVNIEKLKIFKKIQMMKLMQKN